MLTIKKQTCGIAALVVGAAACFLLSGCEPEGSRALHRGDDLIKHGQYEEAISTLRESVGLLSHDPPAVQARAWHLLGLAYQDAAQTADARKCYGQALKLDRNLTVANYNLGCLELEDKHYAQAIDYLSTYTNVRPRDAIAYVKLGGARLRYALQMPNPLEKRRQLDEAKRVYDIAQSLAMTAEACNGLGVIELEHRTPPLPASIKAAEKLFATAFQRDPKFAPAILNQGIVSDEYLNDRKTALIKYKEYLLLETNAPNAKQVAAAAHAIDEELRISVVPETSAHEAPVTNQSAVINAPSKPKVSSQPPQPVKPPHVDREPPPSVSKEPLIAKNESTAASAARPTAPPPIEPASPSRVTPFPATNEAPQPQPQPQSEPPQTGVNATEPIASGTRPAPVEGTEQTNAVADTNAPAPSEPPHKESFVISLFKHINPANWFNGKGKKPEDGSASSQASATAAPGASQGASPPGGHFSPPILSVLTRGNRAEAMRLVSEAAAATRESRQTDALQSLQAAVKADPTCYEACFGLGMARIDEKNYPAALEILYQALLIREDSADARYAYAWALDRQRFYQDAAAELEKLLVEHGSEVRAHLLLGNIYARELDEPKQARQQYAAVLALDPANSQAPALRTWLHDNPGQ